MRLLCSALIVTFFAGAAHAEGPLRSDVKRDAVYPPVATAPAAPATPSPSSATTAPAPAVAPTAPGTVVPTLPLPNSAAKPAIPAMSNTVPAVAVPAMAAPAAYAPVAGNPTPAAYAPTTVNPVPSAYAPNVGAPVAAPATTAAPTDAAKEPAVEEVGYDPKVKRDPRGKPLKGSATNPNNNIKTAPAMPMGRTSDASSPHKNKTTASRPSPSSSAFSKAMNSASKNPKMDDDTRSLQMSSEVNSRQSEKKLSKMMGQADKGANSYSSNLNLNNGNSGAGAMSMGSGMGAKGARKISIPRSTIPSGGRRSIASSNYNSSSRNFTMPRSRSISPTIGRTNVGRNYISPARTSFRTANNYSF